MGLLKPFELQFDGNNRSHQTAEGKRQV